MTNSQKYNQRLKVYLLIASSFYLFIFFLNKYIKYLQNISNKFTIQNDLLNISLIYLIKTISHNYFWMGQLQKKIT